MTEAEIRKQAEEQVSQEHPIICVCGRLCTGLHEMHCAKFRQAVERRVKKLMKYAKHSITNS